MDKVKPFFNYVIPIIMVLFFVRNIALDKTDHLDTWMGGGMRMFAKIDKMIYRVAGFNVKHNGKDYFINLRNVPELKDEDVKARILPNEKRTLEILEKIKKITWCYDAKSDKIHLKKVTDSCRNIIDPKNIMSVKVYAINFINESNKVELKLLN